MVLLGLAVCVFVFSGTQPGAEAIGLRATTPPLGAAATFGILSSTYTNTAAGTTITGDLGYTTGPAVAPTVNGTTYTPVSPPLSTRYADAGAAQGTALGNLNAQPCTFTFAPGAIDLAADTTHGPIGVYTPGVYCATGAVVVGTAGISLNGAGTYIFRMTGALDTVANSNVTLAGGASSCDIFWTPGGATTLGATSTFRGTVIDPAGITVGTTVTWEGRALAFGGTVTTTSDTITASACGAPATATPSPTPIPTAIPATATAIVAATSTAITAATATAISGLPPATQTAVAAATAIATLPAATQTAVSAATATAAAGGSGGAPCVANIRGSKVDGAGQGLPGWTIQLLQGSEVIRTTVTDRNGNYDFLGLTLAGYTVQEVQQAGWTAQGPTSLGVTLTACGENLTGFRFVNVRAGAPGPVAAPSVVATPVSTALATTVAVVTPFATVASIASGMTSPTATVVTQPQATPSRPTALPRTGGPLAGAGVLAVALGTLLVGAGLAARRALARRARRDSA